MHSANDAGTTTETLNNADIVKGLKLLLYKETEKNHKLREMFKEQFGLEFDESSLEKELQDKEQNNIP